MPLLCFLDWLTVPQRIEFLFVSVYLQSCTKRCPNIFIRLCVLCKPTGALHSADNILFTIMWARVKVGDNSFAVAAVILWNHLPHDFETSACLTTV